MLELRLYLLRNMKGSHPVTTTVATKEVTPNTFECDNARGS